MDIVLLEDQCSCNLGTTGGKVTKNPDTNQTCIGISYHCAVVLIVTASFLSFLLLISWSYFLVAFMMTSVWLPLLRMVFCRKSEIAFPSTPLTVFA